MLRKIGFLTLLLALIGAYSWTRHQAPVEVASFSSTTRPPSNKLKPEVGTSGAATSGATASSASLAAQPSADATRAPQAISTREQFNSRFPSDWQFLTSEDGTIRSILGGQVHGYENSAQGALRFAQDISPLLGAKPDELRLEEIAVLNTPLRRAYRVLQTYQGYAVYQSQVTVFFLNGADTIVSLNSQLQTIERWQGAPSLNQGSVQDALLKAVDLESSTVSLTGPLLYVKDKVAHPAYIAVGTRLDVREGWEFVVDARSGEILHQYARNPDESAR